MSESRHQQTSGTVASSSSLASSMTPAEEMGHNALDFMRSSLSALQDFDDALKDQSHNADTMAMVAHQIQDICHSQMRVLSQIHRKTNKSSGLITGIANQIQGQSAAAVPIQPTSGASHNDEKTSYISQGSTLVPHAQSRKRRRLAQSRKYRHRDQSTQGGKIYLDLVWRDKFHAYIRQQPFKFCYQNPSINILSFTFHSTLTPRTAYYVTEYINSRNENDFVKLYEFFRGLAKSDDKRQDRLGCMVLALETACTTDNCYDEIANLDTLFNLFDYVTTKWHFKSENNTRINPWSQFKYMTENDWHDFFIDDTQSIIKRMMSQVMSSRSSMLAMTTESAPSTETSTPIPGVVAIVDQDHIDIAETKETNADDLETESDDDETRAARVSSLTSQGYMQLASPLRNHDRQRFFNSLSREQQLPETDGDLSHATPAMD